jgi:hypothetical protein
VDILPMNTETGKTSVGQIGCLSVVGLILVPYSLGKASEHDTATPGPGAARACGIGRGSVR